MLMAFSLGNVWGVVVSGTTYTTDPKTPSIPANWTVSSYANDANYTKLASSTNCIQTDEFCQNGFTSIKIKARKFGGPSAAQGVISVDWWETGASEPVTLGTLSPSGTSLAELTISTPASVTVNKSGYIKISCKGASGGKGCGVSEVTITYTAGSCGSSCSNTVTITKGAETNGTYTLSATEICGDGEGEDVTISDITPDPGYAFDEITTSASGTVDNVNMKVTGITASTTITVKFKELTKYTVTWNVNGATSTSQVYEGEKPVFPATPASCDGTSTTFVGWATEPWSGKIANLNDKTVYTSADAMPAVSDAVTYYAVFAKSSGAAGKLFNWEGGASADFKALDGVELSADSKDYAAENAPYLIKWNGTGKYAIIAVDSQPGKVSFAVKMIGGATSSTVTVQESTAADGTFTDVETLTISGSSNDVVNLESTKAFKSTTRAIKLFYTKGSNVGLGPISIEGAVSYSDYLTTCAEIKNAVTFAAPTGGTLSILNGEEAVTTGAEIVEGTPLIVTATPDAENHYIGGTIKVVKTSDESDVTASVLDGSTLTMPDYAITISATFTPTYAINLVAEGGSIALDYTKGGAADGYAIAGTEIMATATADDAHVFASLALSENVTVKEIDEYVATFTMPAEAVTITATFNVKSTPTIATDVAEVAFDATDYKGELAAKTFHVNGVALVAGKLTITSNNEAFSVSPAEIDVDGALDETEITITPRTTECGIFKGKITISGGNAEDKEVAVSLTVNKLPANLAWSAEEATVTINADDNVFPTLTNPRNLPVVYSSLYPEVASVNAETGAVELLKAGETMIIVNFAGNDTVTALAEDALSYTLTVQQKHTVEWYINGEKKGEQTAVAGVELENIPDATSIENGAIAGKVFRGWATAIIKGEVDEAQAGIVATPTVMPGGNTRYYAVYATEEGGEEDVTTIKYSGSSTTNMTGNNDAATLGLDANEWSVVGAKGSNSNFPGLNKAGDIRLYYNAGGSNKITITAPKSVDFVRMTFNTGYENVSVTVGGNPVAAVDGAYSINATTFVLGNANSSNVQVQIKTIDVVFATPISYTKYATSGPKKLANPTFGLAEDTYTEAQSVSITAGEGETIYYTLDGTEPTTESTPYTAAIALDSYGSYTIKAIAAKEDGSKSDVVTATYGINIPFETVSDLFTYIESGKAFLGNISVTGVVSKIVDVYSAQHSNITFNISDTGAESEAQFQSFRGVGEGIAEKVAVGDKVTITGEYTLYNNETHELKQGNTISNRVAAEVTSVVISGEATKTEYFYNEKFLSDGLTAKAIYNTGYEKDVTSEESLVWTADPAKVTATGNVNVTATYGGKTSDAKVVAVTKKLRELTNEEFDWTDKEDEIILFGHSATPATRVIVNTHDLPVSYSSNDENIMTVNETTGEITAKAVGSASLLVSFAGNDEYQAANRAYNVKVYGFDHIELSGEATKTAYEYDDLFEFAGLTATAVYTLGEQTPQQLDVTELATWNASPKRVSADGNIAVTATWQEKTTEPVNVAVTVIKHKVTIVQPDHGTLVVKYSKDDTQVTSGAELVLGTQLIFEIIPESSDYKAGKVLVNNKPIDEMEGTIGRSDYEFSAQIFEKKEAGIEWSTTYGEIQVQGTEIVNSDLPSLTNPYELTITYSSENTDVAEIDPATGEITPKASGSTKIYATFAGNDDYKAAQVSYDLNVDVIVPVVKLAYGIGEDWSQIQLTPNEDYTKASVKVNFAADSWPNFKIIVDGGWRGNGYEYKRDFTGASGITENGANMYFHADFEGEYTFTWTYATNAIEIGFPDMPEPEYYIAGDFTSWETNMAKMTEDAGMYNATVTINATKAQKFKVVRVQGPYKTWYGLAGEATMTPDNCENWIIGGGNTDIGLQPNYAGKYTFYFVPEDMKLTIDMPTEQGTALDNTEAGETAVKVMQNGQLLIIKNGKTYNAQGAVVK